jgi:hypothetical protein
LISQHGHVLLAKDGRRIAHGEAMSFGLAGLYFLIDPIELDDEMLNLAGISKRDTCQVEESPVCPALSSCKGTTSRPAVLLPLQRRWCSDGSFVKSGNGMAELLLC